MAAVGGADAAPAKSRTSDAGHRPRSRKEQVAIRSQLPLARHRQPLLLLKTTTGEPSADSHFSNALFKLVLGPNNGAAQRPGRTKPRRGRPAGRPARGRASPANLERSERPEAYRMSTSGGNHAAVFTIDLEHGWAQLKSLRNGVSHERPPHRRRSRRAFSKRRTSQRRPIGTTLLRVIIEPGPPLFITSTNRLGTR